MGASLEILDCNDPLLNVKIPKNPIYSDKDSLELSAWNVGGLEFPSLFYLRMYDNPLLPTGVIVPNIPKVW